MDSLRKEKTARILFIPQTLNDDTIKPDKYILRIAPSIPADWDQFTIEKDFRGKHLHIVVENPEHVQSGCKALYVNEEKMEDNYIPVEKMTDQTKVRLVMA